MQRTSKAWYLAAVTTVLVHCALIPTEARAEIVVQEVRTNSTPLRSLLDDLLSDSAVMVTPLWELGTSDGFAEVVDVAATAEDMVFALDGGNHLLRAVGADGQLLWTQGRTGTSPGNFSDPKALAVDESSKLYVLDRANGISVIRTTGSGSPRMESAYAVPEHATDLCVLGGYLYTYAEFDEQILHRRSRDGDGGPAHSFGGLFGPDGHVVQRIISSEGVIACSEELGVVLAASRFLPEVRAYRADDGALLWSRSVPNFDSVRVELGPPAVPEGTYRMSQPPQGASLNVVLEIIEEPGLAILQSVQRPLDGGPVSVSTCFLAIRTGDCISTTRQLPLLPVLTERLAIGRLSPPNAGLVALDPTMILRAMVPD